MKRLFILLLMISVLLFSITACQGTQEVQESDGNSEQNTDVQTEEPTEDEAPADDQSKEDTPAPEPAAQEPDTFVAAELPEPTVSSLPRWRGFNLLEKFTVSSNAPFKEDDFKWIAELGFNFVRLPMDYRCWIVGNDWNKINEKTLEDIDKAVEWGQKYGVHVQINFHRGPGYCVNAPAEPESLWTSTNAQEAFIRHWVMFAERYKGIPNKNLSFNLLNEPGGVDNNVYARVVENTVKAIHEADPERLIVIDASNYGTQTVPEAKGVAESVHDYQPFGVTHYKASWVEGSDTWAVPQWPVSRIPDKLYGVQKPDLNGPLVIEGDFKDESALSIRVQIVSNFTRLIVKADGKEVFNQMIKSGPGEGDWKQEVYQAEWDIYQNIFDKDYTATIPANTKKIEVEVKDGDWLSFSQVEIKSLADADKDIVITPTMTDWGIKPISIKVAEDGELQLTGASASLDKDWIKNQFLSPWIELKNQGVGVMVGEWGVHNKTPHDVTLRWMKDTLEAFQEENLGWALWNFRGSFGVLDSLRTDVKYVDFHGHRLDQEMLDLLQSY